MSQAKKFAKLLTEAVYLIRDQENTTIASVQDQLGYAIDKNGGSAIEFWRRGNRPAQHIDLENLALAIKKRCEFESQWFTEFLVYGGHDDPETFCKKLFPDDFWPHKLIGRNALLTQLMTLLRDPAGHQLITIDGMGGIGKTALAQNLATQSKRETFFEEVVWLSASYGTSPENRHFNFESVLDAIARQLEMDDLIKLQRMEKENQVQSILRNRRILLVLDNLETAIESQHQIAKQLQSLLNPSKAILTSRIRFTGDSFPVRLPGLTEDDALQFIRQQAIAKSFETVKKASFDELRPVAQATGGSPLALQLVVGQLEYLPPEVVTQHLRQATPIKRIADEDEYLEFYKFIFLNSWKLLTGDDEQLLMAMAAFSPSAGGSFEMVKRVSDLEIDLLTSCIHALWRYSFLEIGDGATLQQRRYYLHPLTHNFVLSEMVKVL